MADEYVLVDDIVDGEDGRVYLDDQPFTGQLREFFPDGPVSGLVHYSNGIEDGPQQVFYRNGHLRSEGHMDHGHKTGIWREWYSNGQLKSEARHGEQRMPLTRRTWTEDGAASDVRVSEDALDYDDADRPWLNGALFTGTAVDHLRDGSLVSEADYENGAFHGWVRLYYEGGQLKEEDHYVNGARDGSSRAWYRSGALRYEAIYGDVPRPDSLLLLREWNEDGTEKT